MDRSIAEGSWPLPRAGGRASAGGVSVLLGAVLVVAFFALYLLTRPAEQILYNHFVWQADAFLHGQATIAYPVTGTATSLGNDYFNDVEAITDAFGNPTGRGLIPFPPLPAVLLVPFVALWGMATDQGLISVVLGAVDVALAFWLLGRLPIRAWLRTLLAIFVAGGSALWYAASIGTTWYFAHVIAVGLTLASVAVALEADERERDRGPGARRPLVDRRQVLAGLLLGLAATSRLTVGFGAIFLVFVGGGGDWRRRALGAAVGAGIPIAVLLAYNQLTTGSIFTPVYQHLYDYEVWAYPELNYHADWALQDLRYIPQNLGIMLFGLPTVMPPCAAGVGRTLVSTEGCSWLVPQAVGMSFVLASPAYLLALGAVRRLRDRRVAGALVATALIAFVNLMHFSQGWVQFGYRFSLDFAPFLLVAVALGAERLADRRTGRYVAGGLVAASVIVQAWGIGWARTLGW